MSPLRKMGIHLDRARQLFDLRRYDLAERELRDELAVEPNSAVAHAMLGVCLARSDRLKEALEEVETAIGLDPEMAYAHSMRSWILRLQKRWTEAEKAIREAIRINPQDPDYFGELSFIHYRHGRCREAFQTADQGLRLNPTHNACLNCRALALGILGREREALQTVRQALGKEPEDAYTHANLGWLLLHSIKSGFGFDKSFVHFRAALELDPNLEWAREGALEIKKNRATMLLFFVASSTILLLVLFAAMFPQMPFIRLLCLQAILYVAAFCFPFCVSSAILYLIIRVNRFDHFGRQLLSRDDVSASNCALGCLLAAGISAAIGFLTNDPFKFLLLNILLIVPLLVSLTAIFECPFGRPRKIMTIFAAINIAATLTGMGFVLLESNTMLCICFSFVFGGAVIALAIVENYK